MHDLKRFLRGVAVKLIMLHSRDHRMGRSDLVS